MASGGNKLTLITEWKEWRDVVVSTAGDGKAEARDGIGIAAGLSLPWAMIESGDGKSLVFTESGSHRIRRYELLNGRVSTLLGSEEGFKIGGSKSSAQFPSVLCSDPLKPNNLYIGDYSSIRYWDSATDQITLIAGDEKEGYADGVGSNARFNSITGLLCHPNGKTLFVCDRLNNCIRKVDLIAIGYDNCGRRKETNARRKGCALQH